MPQLPDLPFGVDYRAVGVFLLALLVAVIQQFFADWIKAQLARLWGLVAGRRRGIRADEWRRYRAWVARTYNRMELGFVRDVSVTLDEVYVPLEYEQDGRRVDVYRDVRDRRRTVILGAAGAGKSMLLRHSMVRWAAAPERFERVPVLVELARSNRDGRPIRQLITEALGRLDDDPDGRRRHRRARPLVADAAQVVEVALASGQLCVFLDGLDEVVTERRGAVADEIKEFAERHSTTQVVVTCRDAVYDGDLRPVFDREIRVAGFDDAGIRHFLRLWFTRRDGGDAEHHAPGRERDEVSADSRHVVEQLLAELRSSPTVMRLARSPLMLTMITTLYEADAGAGPMLTNSRAEFYQQAVEHLLRRDRDLGRHRNLARYQAGHKLMALRAIALAAQGGRSQGTDRRVIGEAEVYAELARILPRFRLAEEHLPRMVDEIVERSGLLIRIDDNNLLYEFAHLTLQEYLAAVELADDPDRLLGLYRENPSRWRETVKLWCAGANRDASGVIRQIFAGDGRDRLLALECVAEARQLDESLAATIVDSHVRLLGTPAADKHLVLAALGAVSGNSGPFGQRLFDSLAQQARSGGSVAEDAVVALAESRRREAIELLSEMAVRVPAARAALRATGELAIPTLAARAGAGSVAAVDDLAAIGTPAAAVALAEQLWARDRQVAVRAAWRLATLVDAPDVENELRTFDPTAAEAASVAAEAARLTGRRSGRLPGAEWYDWLWAPFEPGTPMARTMGRLGWLILESTDDAPGDLGTVDVRLAIGLVARPDAVSAGKASKELTDELNRKAHSLGYKRLLSGAFGAYEIRDMLDLVARREPEAARDLAVQALGSRVSGWRAALLTRLPMPVLTELASRLWTGGVLDADLRDWRTLNERPEAPTVLTFLRNVAVTLGALAGVVLVGIAVIRSFSTVIGRQGGWGKEDLAALVLVCTAFLVISFVVALFMPADHDLLWLPAVVLMISGVGLMVAGAPVAFATVTGWLGVTLTVVVAAVLVGAMVVLVRWTRHRERALRNPYRALLDRAPTARTAEQTVIGRQATGGSGRSRQAVRTGG
ncbi:NACHT domain-containing protein [Verrucosispora sp. WMMA2121]|uniref:NACHT domain-containing protein n=1 Tax=Verrucosispora sp. WMMA2121 TaxID=3015164 RepID=UPI0022B6D8A1|nr:NACHT domain-containing protein [Verrucosispora sp. WMMA2121]MCZ7420686.1 NACHT domain-containing protein [Verrucosispora sp. WMMA2121]